MNNVKKFIQSRNFLLVLIFLGVFLIGFTGTYLTLSLAGKPNAQAGTAKIEVDTVEPTQEPFEPVNTQGSYSVALLGSGGEGHSGGTLTDSIIIVSVDSKNQKAAMISVPRDLWVPGDRKINAEMLANGVGGLKSTLQGITGLEIEKYISVDFSGFIKAVDDLGGIEVNVPKSFDDYFYPIKGKENETCGLSPAKIAEVHQKYTGFELEKQFTCRWEHIHFDKGTTQVGGEEALKLARSRHGDSDFGRSARQFAILKGILNKLITLNSLNKIDDTYKTFSKIVKTDIDLKTAKQFAKVFGNPNEYEISEVHLSTQNVLNETKSADGQYILVPKAGGFNFSEIKSYVSK